MVLPEGSTLATALEGADDSPALIVTAAEAAEDGGSGASASAGAALRLSRAELRALVASLARRLAAAGVAPGDVVALSMANTAEFLVAFLAITQARAVAAPFNAAYKQDEFHWYMDDARARLLLLPAEGNARAAAAAESLGLAVATVELVRSGGGEAGGEAAKPPTLRVADAAPGRGANSLALCSPAADAAAADAGAAPRAPLPGDVALFLHTSGTTSKPKGVPLTHGNIAASLGNIVATYELTPSDVSYMVMPLFHVHGLMAGTLAPLAAAGAVVLPAAGRFSAGAFWREAKAHGATFYTAVPTMHQVLLERAAKDFPKESPPPLRFIRSCSSSLAAPTMKALEETFGVRCLGTHCLHACCLVAWCLPCCSQQLPRPPCLTL